MDRAEKGNDNSPLPLRLEETRDGSHTLIRTDLDESYHSHRGAKSESIHVFIERGLDFIAPEVREGPVTILEVGFGTGLNALLTWQYAEDREQAIHYHTLEPYPVPFEFVEKLNYASVDQQGVFRSLHDSPWLEDIAFGPFFLMKKYRERLEDFSQDLKVQLVYMDAFAPSKQAEIWHPDNLSRCYELLVSGGVLVTYCAQGQFKRDLRAIGFEVEILEGALGKKEMVRAHKP